MKWTTFRRSAPSYPEHQLCVCPLLVTHKCRLCLPPCYHRTSHSAFVRAIAIIPSSRVAGTTFLELPSEPRVSRSFFLLLRCSVTHTDKQLLTTNAQRRYDNVNKSFMPSFSGFRSKSSHLSRQNAIPTIQTQQ